MSKKLGTIFIIVIAIMSVIVIAFGPIIPKKNNTDQDSTMVADTVNVEQVIIDSTTVN